MTFAGVTIVVLRESLEALLILGVLWGILTRLERPDGRAPLLWGAVAGLALSVLLGIAVVRGVQDLSKTAEEAIEGFGALLAVAVLTYMVIWMYQHTRRLLSALEARTRAALEAGKGGVLFLLSFAAVAREGFETVIFIGASVPDGALEVAGGALAGIAISAALALLLFTGVVRLDLRAFFAVTGALLVVFAGGLLMAGLHELMEIGLVPETAVLWDLSATLPHKEGFGALLNAIVGYRANPRLLEAAAWVLYVGALGAWYLRAVLAKPKAGLEPVAAGPPQA